MPWHASELYYFLKVGWYSIGRMDHVFFTHSLTDTWVACTFWPLWLMLPWTLVCQDLFESLLSNLVGQFVHIYLEVELLEPIDPLGLIFRGKAVRSLDFITAGSPSPHPAKGRLTLAFLNSQASREVDAEECVEGRTKRWGENGMRSKPPGEALGILSCWRRAQGVSRHKQKQSQEPEGSLSERERRWVERLCGRKGEEEAFKKCSWSGVWPGTARCSQIHGKLGIPLKVSLDYWTGFLAFDSLQRLCHKKPWAGNSLAVQWLRLCFQCKGPEFNPWLRN